MAYLINWRFDNDEEIIRADLIGGNKEFGVSVEWEGRVVRDANLTFCFMTGIRIEGPLLAALPHTARVELNLDGSLPDVGPGLQSSWIVSQTFVDIAETLEPGKHQFFAIEGVDASTGRPLSRKLYLLNVLTRVGATVIEQSDVIIKRMPSGSDVIQPRLPVRRMTLEKSLISNLHLWRGGAWDLADSTFCSDSFFQAMSAAGIRGLSYLKCDEI